MNKKILLITYTFLPEQNPRAFRWGSLIKAFLKFGYEIDVLMPKYQDIIRKSETVGVRYYETRPYVFYDFVYKHIIRKTEGRIIMFKKRGNFQISNVIKKILAFLARTFIWPDVSGFWFFPARKKIKELIRVNNYNYIISSCPGFVDHLLGYYTKIKSKNTKWIGEYGDPHSFNPARPRNIFNFINKPVERIILRQMEYIVVPVEKSKVGFLKHFPFLNEEKIKVIPQSLAHIKPDSGSIDWSYFDPSLVNIVYTGTLCLDIRNPEILFRSLLKFKQIDTEGYKKLRFHFFGKYDNVENVFKTYKELSDDGIIVLYGEVSRQNCSFACQKANFVLNISNISDYQTPSKLIEYLSYKKQIISLESKKNTELNWPFLIKVDYEVNAMAEFLKNLSHDTINTNFSFSGYNDITEKYDLDNIARQYVKLFL